MLPDQIKPGHIYAGNDETRREVVYCGDNEVFSMDSTTDYTNTNGWDAVTEHGIEEFCAWAVREVFCDQR